MKISYLCPEKDIWHTFTERDIHALFLQDTSAVCAMFEYHKPAVVMEIDGGYVCTKNIFKDVRKNHKQVVTFDSIKNNKQPFYKTLGVKSSINERGLQCWIMP